MNINRDIGYEPVKERNGMQHDMTHGKSPDMMMRYHWEKYTHYKMKSECCMQMQQHYAMMADYHHRMFLHHCTGAPMPSMPGMHCPPPTAVSPEYGMPGEMPGRVCPGCPPMAPGGMMPGGMMPGEMPGMIYPPMTPGTRMPYSPSGPGEWMPAERLPRMPYSPTTPDSMMPGGAVPGARIPGTIVPGPAAKSSEPQSSEVKKPKDDKKK